MSIPDSPEVLADEGFFGPKIHLFQSFDSDDGGVDDGGAEDGSGDLNRVGNVGEDPGDSSCDLLDEPVLGSSTGDDEHPRSEDDSLLVAQKRESFFGQSFRFDVGEEGRARGCARRDVDDLLLKRGDLGGLCSGENVFSIDSNKLFSGSSGGSSSSEGNSDDISLNMRELLLLLRVAVGELLVVDRDEGEFVEVGRSGREGGSLSSGFDDARDFVGSERGGDYLSAGLARRAEDEDDFAGGAGHAAWSIRGMREGIKREMTNSGRIRAFVPPLRFDDALPPPRDEKHSPDLRRPFWRESSEYARCSSFREPQSRSYGGESASGGRVCSPDHSGRRYGRAPR